MSKMRSYPDATGADVRSRPDTTVPDTIGPGTATVAPWAEYSKDDLGLWSWAVQTAEGRVHSRECFSSLVLCMVDAQRSARWRRRPQRSTTDAGGPSTANRRTS